MSSLSKNLDDNLTMRVEGGGCIALFHVCCLMMFNDFTSIVISQ